MTGEAFLTIPEVARALRISRSCAYELAAAGQIPTKRWGRRLLVPARWVDDLVQRVISDWELDQAGD